jgi:hypothetical protein
MSDHVYATLLGAEDVRSAGHSIQAAAASISSAVNSLWDTTRQLSSALDEHTTRIERALEDHAARVEAAMQSARKDD